MHQVVQGRSKSRDSCSPKSPIAVAIPRDRSVHPLMEPNATDAFLAARKRVDSQLAELQKLLHGLANRAATRPEDWGHAATIEQVASVLSEAVRALSDAQEPR